MKKEIAIIILALMAIVFLETRAVEEIQFGRAVYAGEACKNEGNELESPFLGEGFLKIPFSTAAKKTASGGDSKRSSCQLVLPISLPQGFKLILRDLEAPGTVNLAKNNSAALSLEVFQTGSRGQIIRFSEAAGKKRLRKYIIVVQDGLVLESECGGNFLLRANLSATIKGEAGRSTIGLDQIEASAQLVKCED